MKILKPIVYAASLAIFCICLYIFLLGNGVLEGVLNRSPGAETNGGVGAFKNDPFSWYFLAKGMFCSLSLYLSVTLIDAIHSLKAAIVQNVQQPAVRAVETPQVAPPLYTTPTISATAPEKSWYQARQGVRQ